jgi:uncharacterized protein involved in type VI secretion and phage assembly
LLLGVGALLRRIRRINVGLRSVHQQPGPIRYKISLVPHLQFLQNLHHRTNQHIYLQMSAPKIITLILEERGIKATPSLTDE